MCVIACVRVCTCVRVCVCELTEGRHMATEKRWVSPANKFAVLSGKSERKAHVPVPKRNKKRKENPQKFILWKSRIRCRSLDMVNFLSHREQGKRGPSSSLWCCFLWRTRFLFCTYDFPHSGQRCRSTGTYFCGAEVINR